jgi:hypothetical protein
MTVARISQNKSKITPYSMGGLTTGMYKYSEYVYNVFFYVYVFLIYVNISTYIYVCICTHICL